MNFDYYTFVMILLLRCTPAGGRLYWEAYPGGFIGSGYCLLTSFCSVLTLHFQSLRLWSHVSKTLKGSATLKSGKLLPLFASEVTSFHFYLQPMLVFSSVSDHVLPVNQQCWSSSRFCILTTRTIISWVFTYSLVDVVDWYINFVMLFGKWYYVSTLILLKFL